jgi:WD40-like Beta Propeller Repeat.
VSNIASESPALSWSPDGKTIAYQNGGVVFYSLISNASNIVINNIDDKWVYTPNSFSPDGSTLMVSAGCRFAFYHIASQILILWDSSSNDTDYSCGGTRIWSSDSKRFYLANGNLSGGTEGMRLPGLWRYTTDGKGTNLLPSPFIDNKYMYNKAIAVWEDSNTGDLFFLFSPPGTGIDNPLIPFYLVHSGPDAVTNRTTLRPETFHLDSAYQILWAPDGSFLIIVQNGEKINFNNIILVPTNPALPVITLIADASTFVGNLRWGP